MCFPGVAPQKPRILVGSNECGHGGDSHTHHEIHTHTHNTEFLISREIRSSKQMTFALDKQECATSSLLSPHEALLLVHEFAENTDESP